MDCSRVLIILLVAAMLLSNLVVTDLAERQTFPQPAAVAAVGLGLGQIALGAFWLAYARWNITLRVAVLLAAIAFWAGPIADVTDQAVTPWLGILLLYVAMAGAAAMALKAHGFRLSPADPAGNRDGRGSQLHRWQFGLWDILSYTTAVCVLMAVVRLLDFPWAAMGNVVVFCLGATFAAAIALCVPLASQRILPAAVAIGAAALIGALMALVGIPPQPAWSVAAMTGVEALCVACGAIVLRAGGHRLVRQSS